MGIDYVVQEKRWHEKCDNVKRDVRIKGDVFK
jgi:hypothetical protein